MAQTTSRASPIRYPVQRYTSWHTHITWPRLCPEFCTRVYLHVLP